MAVYMTVDVMDKLIEKKFLPFLSTIFLGPGFRMGSCSTKSNDLCTCYAIGWNILFIFFVRRRNLTIINDDECIHFVVVFLQLWVRLKFVMHQWLFFFYFLGIFHETWTKASSRSLDNLIVFRIHFPKNLYNYTSS